MYRPAEIAVIWIAEAGADEAYRRALEFAETCCVCSNATELVLLTRLARDAARAAKAKGGRRS